MLKVMTLNMNYYGTRHGPWPARRDLIAEVISSAGPDIVALQAVCADPRIADGIDQAHQLARLLPDYEHVSFQAAVPAAAGPGQAGGGAEGSAFLSRLPLAAADCLALSLRPGLEDTNQRVLLHARLDLPAGGPVHLFNAHFSWVYGQAQDNLAEATAYMATFAGPALLVGDMNTLPDSELWQPLKAGGWVDTWRAWGAGDDGYTYESDRPYMRIDYAWANPALAALPAEGRAIAVLAAERAGARMSDHRGLLVTL